MRPDIRITHTHWETLRAHLLQDSNEHAAILLCGTIDLDNPTLTCRSVVLLDDNDVITGPSGLHLEVSPVSIARIAKQARNEGLTMVMCHSHPFGGPVMPSAIDIATEEELCGRVLHHRLAERPIGSLIIGYDGVSARIWRGPDRREATVHVIGRTVTLLGDGTHTTAPARGSEEHDRQVLLWGLDGQAILANARIAIIGAGGTGSHVASQLAHLGVGYLLLIDPDIVETSNLSRVIGATAADVGRLKVDVVADHVRQINRHAFIETLAASVLDLDPTALAGHDVIVCSTDGHGSRLLLTEVAQQFIVPVVDLGIEIQPGATSARAGGGVRILRPGDACQHCMGVLDAGLVREEFLSDDERLVEAERGYLRSGSVPAPSVVALNGVIASLAVVEVFDLLVDVFADKTTRILYRAEQRATSTTGAARDPRCYVCGPDGILGLGLARALPRRQPRAG